MKGVTIGEKHTFKDWGLYLGKDTSISFPEIKEETIDIPGADNVIDLSEVLTGDVQYKRRSIKLILYAISKKNWKKFISEIANYLHGQDLKIIFDDDPNWYYIGRCKLNALDLNINVGKITIEVTAEAYKYHITSTTEDWIWDSFNFEEDVIEEYKDLTVDGILELNLINSRMKVIPTFTVSSEMTIEFNEEIYTLAEGENQLLDIQLSEGENKIIITGNGTISIDYRRGCL